jgi:hypothetical protein
MGKRAEVFGAMVFLLYGILCKRDLSAHEFIVRSIVSKAIVADQCRADVLPLHPTPL